MKSKDIALKTGEIVTLLSGSCGTWRTPFDGMRVRFPVEQHSKLMEIAKHRISVLTQDLDRRKEQLRNAHTQLGIDTVRSHIIVLKITLKETKRIIGMDDNGAIGAYH